MINDLWIEYNIRKCEWWMMIDDDDGDGDGDDDGDDDGAHGVY